MAMSGFILGQFLCVMSYVVVSGAQDATDGHIFVGGVGAVGRRGLGPSP